MPALLLDKRAILVPDFVLCELLIFFFLKKKTGSHYVDQAGLKLAVYTLLTSYVSSTKSKKREEELKKYI